MKCYQEKCADKAVAYCIVDDYVACEQHAVSDYFRYFEEVSA
jgi:hypothetical protein